MAEIIVVFQMMIFFMFVIFMVLSSLAAGDKLKHTLLQSTHTSVRIPTGIPCLGKIKRFDGSNSTSVTTQSYQSKIFEKQIEKCSPAKLR